MPKKRYTNKEIMDYLKRLESKIDQINNESIISKGFALVSIGVAISAIAIPIYIELIGINKLGLALVVIGYFIGYVYIMSKAYNLLRKQKK